MSLVQVGFVPYEIEKSGVRLRPSSIAAGVMLGAKHTLASGLYLGVELGASFALLSHRPRFNDQWRSLPRDSSALTPELNAGLGVGWEWSSARLGLFATLGVPLADDDYIVQSTETGERRTLLAPWPVQPGLSLRTLL